MLKKFLQNKNLLLTRKELFEAMSALDKNPKKYISHSNVVDVYVSYLRRKVDGKQDEKLIHTIRDFGYKIKSKK